MAIKTKVLNSKGENIILSDNEEKKVLNAQKIVNATGFEIDITTLTGLIKSITEQKFYQVRPSDYFSVIVGENAWATNTLKYVSYDVADDFEKGDVNTGASNSRLAQADSALEGIENKIKNWAKGIGWSLMDLQHAMRAGNFDLITSKEKARKTNYDLGIQRIAFLGHRSDAAVKGLLTLSTVNANTTLITKYLKDMNATEFQQFLSDIYADYRTNSQNTAEPTKFVIPEADYNGLGSAVDETFNMKSRLQRIEENFRLMTKNPNFEVLKLAYGDQVNNADVTGLNKNRYVLYNDDPDTLRMDVPVAYTSTLANTVNGFNYENVGYSQYSGVKEYRAREIRYYDWS